MNPNPVNLYWKRKDGLLSRKEREYIDGSPSCRREFERIDELLSALPWKEPPSPPLLPEGFFPEPLSLWQRLLYPTAVATGLALGLLTPQETRCSRLSGHAHQQFLFCRNAR